MKRQMLGGLLILLVAVISLSTYIYSGGRFTSSHGGQPVRSEAQARLPIGPPRARAQAGSGDADLIARLISGEAEGEPFEGQVAVGAVILNRTRDSRFPHTVSGVIYEPWAFESVTNGLIWQRTPSDQELQAANSALSGWDPSYGSLFFWNPSKPVSSWIWSRQIIRYIGSHVFAL